MHVTTAALAVAVLDRSPDASNGINKLYAQLLKQIRQELDAVTATK